MTFIPFARNALIGFTLLWGAVLLSSCSSSDKIVLRGASIFEENHAYSQGMLKFAELTKEYYGKPVDFQIYFNGELGLEKDYFAYMSQGTPVDFSILSPSSMSSIAPVAPVMDMPFLFRDKEHWAKVLEAGALNPISDMIETKSDVLILGYAGGGARQLIVTRPIATLDDLKSLGLRVMGAPIQTRIFQAVGASPTVISYNEIYNAMQTGVIDAAENEAAGIMQMKFYEVGPEISLTEHAITVRPFCFSGKTFRKLPEDLQAALRRAGAEAAVFTRALEVAADEEMMAQMEQEGKLRTHVFRDRDQLLELAEPVKLAYARELGVEEFYQRISAIK